VPSLAIPGDIIHFDAVDCVLSGDYQIDGTAVIVAADPGGSGSAAFINWAGIGSFTMPDEIPAGDYIVRIEWDRVNWGAGNGSSIGFNGITENGSVEPGQWHGFTAAAGGAGNVFIWDEIAGPTMGLGASEFDGTGWATETGAFPASITIPPSNLGTIKIDVWDEWTTPNYALFVVNAFEFEEIPEPATIGLLGLGALALLRRRK